MSGVVNVAVVVGATAAAVAWAAWALFHKPKPKRMRFPNGIPVVAAPTEARALPDDLLDPADRFTGPETPWNRRIWDPDYE